MWPAIVVLAGRLPRERIAAIRETHTAKGHHEVTETPFPDWVPTEVTKAARVMDEETALAALHGLFPETRS